MVQVRVREEPVTIVPSGEAVTVTAVGGGTELDNTMKSRDYKLLQVIKT